MTARIQKLLSHMKTSEGIDGPERFHGVDDDVLILCAKSPGDLYMAIFRHVAKVAAHCMKLAELEVIRRIKIASSRMHAAADRAYSPGNLPVSPVNASQLGKLLAAIRGVRELAFRMPTSAEFNRLSPSLMFDWAIRANSPAWRVLAYKANKEIARRVVSLKREEV